MRPGLLRGLLVVALAVLMAATALSAYARWELRDARAFASRVGSALEDRDVRDVVAQRLVDGASETVAPDVLAVRPVLVRGVAAVLASPRFRGVLEAAVRLRHAQVGRGDRAYPVRLGLDGGPVPAVIRRLSPRLADALPVGVSVDVAALRPHGVELVLARVIRGLAGLFWPLLAATAALVALRAVALRGAGGVLADLGVAAAVGGVLVVVLLKILQRVVVAHAAHAADLAGGAQRRAVAAVWGAMFGDLRTAALIVALAGAALAALLSAARGRTYARATASVALAGTAVVVVAAGATALVVPAPSPAPAPAGAPGACNGSRALCARRLDEVVFPATHNSYAAADEPGWYFANQRFGIARQLRDGIRGLLIDLHYGVEDAQRHVVRTDLRYEGSSRNKVVRQIGPEALALADRLAGRQVGGDLRGPRAVYFCHTLCELGAEPAAQELAVIRRFLDAHPRDVLVVFVEPYVRARDVEREFGAAGLTPDTAVLRLGPPLPTLGELVGSGRRLVVLAEEDGGTPPWYLDGFRFAQDTPYDARSAAQLSCRRLRGRPDSPLFLLNHWIATFPPSRRANERIGGAFLARRIADCQRERSRHVNLPAVDFYENSGVVDVARRLNR